MVNDNGSAKMVVASSKALSDVQLCFLLTPLEGERHISSPLGAYKFHKQLYINSSVKGNPQRGKVNPPNSRARPCRRSAAEAASGASAG